MPVGAQNRSHCEAQHLQLLATLESAEKQSPLTPVGTAMMPAVPAVPPIQALSLALLLPPMLSREGQGGPPLLVLHWCSGASRLQYRCSCTALHQYNGSDAETPRRAPHSTPVLCFSAHMRLNLFQPLLWHPISSSCGKHCDTVICPFSCSLHITGVISPISAWRRGWLTKFL